MRAIVEAEAQKHGNKAVLFGMCIHDSVNGVQSWGLVACSRRHIFRSRSLRPSVGKGRNKPDLYFAYGFVVANGWIAQNPSINGYSGAFGYNLATGVTIVVETTKSETTKTDTSAFDILREVAKDVTPATPINF